MEKKANYYEKGIKNKDLEDQFEVNQLYLDSIKAKMALIEYL